MLTAAEGLRKNPIAADPWKGTGNRAAYRKGSAFRNPWNVFRNSWKGMSGVRIGERLRELWDEEDGQDMVEYALLLGFVALSGAAFYISMGVTVSNIWGIVNSRLAAANQTPS